MDSFTLCRHKKACSDYNYYSFIQYVSITELYKDKKNLCAALDILANFDAFKFSGYDLIHENIGYTLLFQIIAYIIF